MSLFEPGTPKYECQIHKSFDATASSMMVGLLISPLTYAPRNSLGQFFHSICVQSMLPSIPGKCHLASCAA
ncbi:hypothetical protein Hanom_Chr05g00429501 [Helianthus anomalus]